ncbi:hypothetical protein Hanom_Chr00s021136g01760481 [Helianthus anomalus]
MMGHVAAPSESKVNLGVFAKKPDNFLKELCEESPKWKAPSKSKHSTSRGSKVIAPDISIIPGLESSPTVVYGDSPIRDPLPPQAS